MSTGKPPSEEPVDNNSSEKRNELTSVQVDQDEEQKAKQATEVLTGIHEQGTSSHDFIESENMHELSTIITDVYSLAGEKFGHDLIHLIESGQSLEHWQHHGYSHAETDSFSHTTNHITEHDSIQPCNSDMHSTSEASVTLTVLNSTNTDEAVHSIPFSFTQPEKHSSSVDHDYYAYHSHKSENHAVMECLQDDNSLHDNSLHMHGQSEMSMDQEKLQRMKRRKEKNRECSRQFRLKQKAKEQRLTLGKVEKSKTLMSMKKNAEKLKAILSKISQKCSSCPKAAMLLHQFVTGSDKENINPNIA